LIAELVGERPSLLLEYVRDHDVRALGGEAARVAGTHSTGTAREQQDEQRHHDERVWTPES
jgi:hypothetical protein